jgi:hypothetical protein
LLAVFDEIRDICISTKPWLTVEEEDHSEMVEDVSENTSNESEVAQPTPDTQPVQSGN